MFIYINQFICVKIVDQKRKLVVDGTFVKKITNSIFLILVDLKIRSIFNRL